MFYSTDWLDHLSQLTWVLSRNGTKHFGELISTSPLSPHPRKAVIGNLILKSYLFFFFNNIQILIPPFTAINASNTLIINSLNLAHSSSQLNYWHVSLLLSSVENWGRLLCSFTSKTRRLHCCWCFHYYLFSVISFILGLSLGYEQFLWNVWATLFSDNYPSLSWKKPASYQTRHEKINSSVVLEERVLYTRNEPIRGYPQELEDNCHWSGYTCWIDPLVGDMD